MNRKVITFFLYILVIFFLPDIASGMQQMLLLDLNRNHTEHGYYVGKINNELDNMTMTASEECPKMCTVKEQPKMCMVKALPKMCMINEQEMMSNFSCMGWLNVSPY